MKLIVAQYLASIREREELDAILPDLLSELGMNVLSRPTRGNRQFGVDVVAIGPREDGAQVLYLVTIKPGDLKRSNWDNGMNTLRPSLNQVLDVYVGNHVPKRYKHLPIVVVICLGGEIHEGVREYVNGYIETHERDGLTIKIWNGDKLAALLLTGVLAENTLPDSSRSNLRKAVALVDEPEIGFQYFCALLENVRESCEPKNADRLKAIRQVYVALWIVFVWARDCDNLEAAYLCSERAILVGWEIAKATLVRAKRKSNLSDCIERLIALHLAIAEEYFAQHVRQSAAVLHGLSSAVPSHSSVDINRRLFDVVGRAGTFGLWQIACLSRPNAIVKRIGKKEVERRVERDAECVMNVINNNPILNSPIMDSQAIDINIACLFLKRMGCDQFIRDWIRQLAHTITFAYLSKTAYPCIFQDYADLVQHPLDERGYQEKATLGSLLMPTLAVWAAILRDNDTLEYLADFVSANYQHSTLQLCYPGQGTEEGLYSGVDGSVVQRVSIERTYDRMIGQVLSECGASTVFTTLSAVQCGVWPVVLAASRHYRIPVPPQLWPLEEGRVV